jgi:hypothetical protein
MLAGLGSVGRVGRHGLGGGSGAASASKRPKYSVDLTKGQLGQGMTFSRASVGTYYDSAGVLRTMGYNQIRNSTMQNAVVGSPGTLPTNWSVPGSPGITVSVVGVGVETGISYIDLSFVGTASAIGTVTIVAEPTTQIAAAVGQTWTLSTYIRLIAGAVTGVLASSISARGTAGAFVGDYATAPLSPTTAPLNTQRVSVSQLLNAAGSIFVQPKVITVGLNSGDVCNFTLRVGAPQIELSTVANTFSPTTNAANSGPRFDYDPVTLQPKGLLLEDASTNIWLQSADASNAAWLKTGNPKTIVANATVSPDGTTTAASVAYPLVSGAGAQSLLAQSFTATAAPYSFSVYLKGAAGGERVYIMATVDAVNYYRTQCILTTAWQRFVVITPALTAAPWFFQIGTDLRDATQTSTPAQTIYAWGAQVEQRDFPTSYIATAGATVTRAIDVCGIAASTVASWFNGTGISSWFAEFDYLDTTPIDNARIIGRTGFPDGVSPMQILSNRTIGQFDSSTSMFSSTVTAANEITRAISSWQPGQAKVCANGGAVATSALLTLSSLLLGFTGISFLSVGMGSVNYSCEGHLRVFKYWGRVLSDTEMQTATALGGPSLSLDFMTPGVLDSRITFTRASTATYFDSSGVMRTAAANAPRWDYDPVTHALRGLLIEEARTNLTLGSGNLAWAVNAALITPNAALAPDGTVSMARLAEQSGTSAHFGSGAIISTVASTTYTFSVFAKAQENRYLQLSLDDNSTSGGFATFDLVTGAVTGPLTARGSGVIGAAVIQPAGNGGTYRCSISTTIGAGTTAHPLLALSNIGNPGITPSYAGNAANGLLIWGAQVEQGSFSTSYIPTTSVAVTRARDLPIIPPNVSWYTSPGGSWFAEFIKLNPSAAYLKRVLQNTSASGQAQMWVWDGSNNSLAQYDNAAAMNTTNGVTVGAVSKGVTTWTPGAAKACLNGGAVASSAALTIGYPFDATGIFMMSVPDLNDSMTGYLRRIQYWPRALSNAEMQQVTT